MKDNKPLIRAGAGVNGIWGPSKQEPTACPPTVPTPQKEAEESKTKNEPLVTKTEARGGDNRNSGGELVTKAFNLKADNYERLRRFAYESHRSASVIVNEAVSDYLDRLSKQAVS